MGACNVCVCTRVHEFVARSLAADPWLHASFLVGGAYAGHKLEGWEERMRIEINQKLEQSKRVSIPGK